MGGSIQKLLEQRLKKGDQTSKMSEMGRQTVNGNLSGFSGVFGVIELSQEEKKQLETILINYSNEDKDFSRDLESLASITSEVKAINNQAAILHGERIHKAHTILTRYRDGAFTAWLMAVYGNRQTPYNYLQYYQFYHAMPRTLRPKLEIMPRQAVYTLASRDAPHGLKQKIVEQYVGQTKLELMEAIKEAFPLAQADKRASDSGRAIMSNLEKAYLLLIKNKKALTKSQIHGISKLISEIKKQIDE